MAQSIHETQTEGSADQDEVTEDYEEGLPEGAEAPFEDSPDEEEAPDEGASPDGEGHLYEASTKSAPYSEGVGVTGKLRVQRGDDLDEALDLYGQDFIYDLYTSQLKQKVQNAIRQRLTDGVRPEEIPDVMADYRPDKTSSRSKSPSETAEKNFDKLSEEDQIAFLERLQEKVGG